MHWAAPDTVANRENQVAEQQMEKLRQHYFGKWRNGHSWWTAFAENSGSSGGIRRPQLSRVQLLQREELRRKELEDTNVVARTLKRTLRKQCRYGFGTERSRYRGSRRGPMHSNGEMTCYLLATNPDGEYTLRGNELEKYRTRIFERVV